MTEIRALVITRKASDLPIDHVTNTLHFDTDSPFTWLDQALEGLNETQLAIDLRNVFRDRWFHTNGMGVEVKMYDLQDPIPRPVRGHANWAALTGQNSGAPAPREVACCLSFRGATNTKRTRGRIFVGPYTAAQTNERPSEGVTGNLMTLAQGIANLGGIDIDWCVRSSFGNAMHPVKFCWADNEWDTIRSRGLKPTSRSTLTVDE